MLTNFKYNVEINVCCEPRIQMLC